MAKKKSGKPGKRKSTGKLPYKPKPRTNVTKKEADFVIHFIRLREKRIAALMAGYSPKNPDQSGYQAFKAIQKKIPDILEHMGLSVPVLIERHLVPLLNSVTVKRAQHEGEFTDFAVEENTGAQVSALDIAMKMHGAYAAKEQIIQKASTVRAIIVDMPRPKRPPELEENVTNGHKPQK